VRSRAALSVVFLTLSADLPLLAQIGATAQLSGTLADPSGRVVTDQSISLQRTGTRQIRVARTSATGQYIFTDVSPGDYHLSADAPGFAPLDVPLQLTIGQQAVLNLGLQLAQNQQTTTVAGNAEALDPTRTELSEMVDARRIEDLPIDGRQFLDFVLLTPNVHTGRTNISNPVSPGEPNQVDLSFAGLHESTNMVLVDGANNINRVFGRPRSAPSEEAVQEFRVLNDTYGPDLGPATGGVVTIITKSGSNDLRGSLYEYFRNNALDAHNLLAPPGFDELRQNQFGGTLGGPIIKDKLFFFGNYEGQRHQESPSYSSILLNNLAPINAAKISLGVPPEVLAGKLRQLNYDTLLSRADYLANANNQVSLSYRFREDRDKNLPAATNQLSAPSNFRNANIDDHAGTVNWASTLSPRLLNQALFQFSDHTFDFPSVTYQPHLQIANTLDMGRNFNAVNGASEFRFQAGDGVSYVKGNHTFRFGGDISTAQDQFFYDPYDPAYIVFPNLAAFLGQAPFKGPFIVTFGFTVAPDGTRPAAPKNWAAPANLPAFNNFVHQTNGQTAYALFAQDQWRAARHLTINYGLRWDVDLMPARVFERYYKAVQPRVGIAYAMLDDRVVLRTGAGYYQGEAYSLVYLIAQVAGQDAAFGLPLGNEYAVFQNTLHSPFYSNPAQATAQALQFLHTGVYPTFSSPTNFGAAQQFISTIKRYNHGGPYSYQWNAQVDMRLARDMTLSANYLGLRGLELPSGIGGNVAPTNLTLPNGEANYVISPSVPVTRTIDPLINPLSFFFDATAQSTYQSGTLSLAKRFSGHYSLTANYTLSKTIDDSGDPSLNGFPQDPYRRYLERANSKQDVPQRFVATAIAEGPARGWLRDFRASVIATAQAAPFYTVFAGTDVNHDGNASTDRVGLLGRDTYRGDRLVDLDLRLARTFRFGERWSAEAIAEAFNITNTLSITDINTVYGAPNFIGAVPSSFGEPVPAPLASFGTIRATSPPRQLQFALRLKF